MGEEAIGEFDHAAVLLAAADFAREHVSPHAVEGTSKAGPCVLLEGKWHHVPRSAPENARIAAGFLGALYRLSDARRDGDLQAVTDAAFGLGLLTSAVWKDIRGETINDLMSKAAARRVKSAEGGKTRLKWTKQVDTMARAILSEMTPSARENENNAAKHIMTELMRRHQKQIGLTTIKDRLFKC